MDEISREVGRSIQYILITPEQFVAGMREDKVPADLVDLLHELFTQVLDGRNTQVMHGVAEALGRPPRSFSDYVRDTAATGVWSP